MMMLLCFDFDGFSLLRRCFRYAFIWLIVRFSSLSDRSHLSILSAHVSKHRDKHSRCTCSEFRTSTESNSSRESCRSKRKNELRKKRSPLNERCHPSIRLLFQPSALLVLDFLLLLTSSSCCVHYKPPKWSLYKCAFQFVKYYNSIGPLIKFILRLQLSIDVSTELAAI